MSFWKDLDIAATYGAPGVQWYNLLVWGEMTLMSALFTVDCIPAHQVVTQVIA